jgi:hypothetical protein
MMEGEMVEDGAAEMIDAAIVEGALFASENGLLRVDAVSRL